MVRDKLSCLKFGKKNLTSNIKCYENTNMHFTMCVSVLPLGRPRRRWEDNIKRDLQEVKGGCVDWMELVQDRDRWRALLSTVMNLRVPKKRGIS